MKITLVLILTILSLSLGKHLLVETEDDQADKNGDASDGNILENNSEYGVDYIDYIDYSQPQRCFCCDNGQTWSQWRELCVSPFLQTQLNASKPVQRRCTDLDRSPRAPV